MAAEGRAKTAIWWVVMIVMMGLLFRWPRPMVFGVGLVIALVVVLKLALPARRRRRARREERMAWAAAPAALVEAKERLLLDDEAGMWRAVRRALFVPRTIPWTLRMIEHDRQVVALLAEHCRDRLSAPDAEALDRLEAHLAAIHGASDLPRIDRHRFAPIVSLAYAHGAHRSAAAEP
jgi:hypothetical protein